MNPYCTFHHAKNLQKQAINDPLDLTSTAIKHITTSAEFANKSKLHVSACVELSFTKAASYHAVYAIVRANYWPPHQVKTSGTYEVPINTTPLIL